MHTHKLCFFNSQNRKLIHAYLIDPLFVGGSLRRHNVCLNALHHKVVGAIEGEGILPRVLSFTTTFSAHNGLLIYHGESAGSTHFQLWKNTTYLTYLSKSFAGSSETWAQSVNMALYSSHRHQAKANKCVLLFWCFLNICQTEGAFLRQWRDAHFSFAFYFISQKCIQFAIHTCSDLTL